MPLTYYEVWMPGGGSSQVTLASGSQGLTVNNAFYRAIVGVGLKNGDTIQYAHVVTYFWHNNPQIYETIALSETPVDNWIEVGSFTLHRYISGTLAGSVRRLTSV